VWSLQVWEGGREENGLRCSNVTECRVWLLAAQKPIKRPGWWKGKCFILEAGNLGAGSYPKADSPPPATLNDEQWTTAFTDRGRGLHAETAQLALAVVLTLVMGGLISVISIVLSTVNLQFQGQFVSISLRPVLGTVAAYVMATVRSSCS